jgi:hypothetical protein
MTLLAIAFVVLVVYIFRDALARLARIMAAIAAVAIVLWLATQHGLRVVERIAPNFAGIASGIAP